MSNIPSPHGSTCVLKALLGLLAIANNFQFRENCSTKCSLTKAAVIHLLSCHENDIYWFYYFASSSLLGRSRILKGKTVELANLNYYNGKIAPE